MIVHGPISFIHDFCGLFGGGGGASFLVDVLVQYFSKKAPETHFIRDRSKDARRTPLLAMDWYLSSWRSSGCVSDRVGKGFNS